MKKKMVKSNGFPRGALQEKCFYKNKSAIKICSEILEVL